MGQVGLPPSPNPPPTLWPPALRFDPLWRHLVWWQRGQSRGSSAPHLRPPRRGVRAEGRAVSAALSETCLPCVSEEGRAAAALTATTISRWKCASWRTRCLRSTWVCRPPSCEGGRRLEHGRMYMNHFSADLCSASLRMTPWSFARARVVRRCAGALLPGVGVCRMPSGTACAGSSCLQPPALRAACASGRHRC